MPTLLIFRRVVRVYGAMILVVGLVKRLHQGGPGL